MTGLGDGAREPDEHRGDNAVTSKRSGGGSGGEAECAGEERDFALLWREAIATIKAARLMAAIEEARTHREAGKVEGDGMGQGEGEGNPPSLDATAPARPVAEWRDADAAGSPESPTIGGPRMDLTERGDVLSCEPGEPRGDNIVKSLREWESLSFNSAEKDLMTQLQAATVSVDS